MKPIRTVFRIWYDELTDLFRDKGILIFILFVPLAYPLLYSWVYTNEVVREVPAAVVDDSRTPQSRAFIRMVDATPDVAVAAHCTTVAEAEELLRRPEIDYPLIAGMIGWGEGITPMLAERLETEIKYAGYIARQDRMIHEVARHEKTLIPEDFSYTELTGLTLEAREKLARIRPKNLGQAGRIPGVSPSDVAQLSIALVAQDKT